MDLALLPWSTLGPWGLVAMFFGLVFIGQLQPKVLVDRDIRLLEKHNDELRAESALNRTAWELSEKARAEQGQQFTTLLESARTTEELLRALKTAGAS